MCVCKGVQMGGSKGSKCLQAELRISFSDQFALGGRRPLVAANENKRRDFCLSQNLFSRHNNNNEVESCRNAYNRNCKPRCVNNLEIVTKVGL